MPAPQDPPEGVYLSFVDSEGAIHFQQFTTQHVFWQNGHQHINIGGRVYQMASAPHFSDLVNGLTYYGTMCACADAQRAAKQE